MNDDEPHEIWYYSHGDEKCGPVSFTDLRALAKQAVLNPRHDLVWTKGMVEWKPAGEIEGLFKRRTQEPSAMQAPTLTPDPYQPPDEDSVAEQMEKQDGWQGARRRSYLFFTLIFPWAWMKMVSAATLFLTAQSGQEIMKAAVPFLMTVPALLILYFTIKRFVNLGMSGWWVLGNFVPFLNIWLGYRCFACPAGYAFHKKLDGAGIFLAIVYWLLLLLGLVVIGLVIAVLFGAAGSPDQQQQLQDILRKAMEPKP